MARVALAKKLKIKSGIDTDIKAKIIIRALILSIQEAIQEEKIVTLAGFGSFKVVKRKARKGRNLKTGTEIYISCCNTIKFTPSKKFAKAISK